MDATAIVSVLLADLPGGGHRALASLIAGTSGVELARDIYDPRRLRTAIDEARPDVVVIDDRLLGQLEGASDERDFRLVVVGLDDDPGFMARARRVGAQAWILKECADALLPILLLSPSASPPRWRSRSVV
jgi:DNA-binding NarL/FixJ family response regulator